MVVVTVGAVVAVMTVEPSSPGRCGRCGHCSRRDPSRRGRSWPFEAIMTIAKPSGSNAPIFERICTCMYRPP